jgi:hypothetical protein
VLRGTAPTCSSLFSAWLRGAYETPHLRMTGYSWNSVEGPLMLSLSLLDSRRSVSGIGVYLPSDVHRSMSATGRVLTSARRSPMSAGWATTDANVHQAGPRTDGYVAILPFCGAPRDPRLRR